MWALAFVGEGRVTVVGGQDAFGGTGSSLAGRLRIPRTS